MSPSPSGSTVTDLSHLDAQVKRKLDFILLPFLSLLFLLNSLDRSNIGNAETAHFTSDVGLEERDLNIAVALFFGVFVLLQPVGAALGRKFGMPIWVPTTMGLWGVCTAAHIFVRSRWQLFGLRIIIGILEAGFYPVTVSYLSLFYTRYEFGRRLALFYGQYAIAGALGGVLSYFVFSRYADDHHHDEKPEEDHNKSLQSWQVLFLLEGCGTIVVALIGFFWLPHHAGSAWFLTKDERRWAEERIERDRDTADFTVPTKHARLSSEVDEEEDMHLTRSTSESRGLLSSTHSLSKSQVYSDSQGISPHDIMSSILSPKIYYLLLCNILSSIPVTAFSVFLPLVVKPFTSHAATANLLTAPPYICGAVTLYAFTYWSDRIRERLRPILASLIVLLIGMLTVATLPSTEAWAPIRYIALCVLLAGTFIASPLTVAWISGNTPSPGKRALMLGINGWGNLAGVFSSLIFAPRFGPSYHTSFIISAICVGLAAMGYFSFRVLLVRENAQRRTWAGDADPDEVRAEEQEGRGAVANDAHRRLLNFAIGVLERVGWRRGKEWVQEVREDGREGDERLTFVYGL